MRRLILAENIVNGYRARAKSENWAMWANGNKVMADILVEAEKLATE